MRDFQSKRRWQKTFSSRISLIILVPAVIFLANGVWGIYSKNRVARENYARVRSELEGLETRQADLEAKVSKLDTVRGQEEVIRKNLPVAKEGERVITIIETPAPTSSTSSSFWERWFLRKQ